MCPINIIKHLVGLLIVSACVVSCNKKNQESEPEPTHDVEIEFFMGDADKKLEMSVLQKLVDDKTVGNIYMVPTYHWNNSTAKSISEFRTKFFQSRIELSPKMHGRGDFDFKLGEASKVPEDSLWFVEQGWSINKAYQNP